MSLNENALEFGQYLGQYAGWLVDHKWYTDVKQDIVNHTAGMTAEEKTNYFDLVLRTAVSVTQNKDQVREIARACEIQWLEGL